MQWVWRGVALAALLIGWLFIAWQNHFHITAPMVFVCLGYLAVVTTVFNLWRTGAAAVDSSEDGVDSTWAKPVGALGELEREKRTLLKAIKEAEFDHQMGKLSQRDADEMIRGYRARAIEVIKEIDRLGLGTAGSVREQILREVRARVHLEGKAPKKPAATAEARASAKGRSAEAVEAASSARAVAAGANGDAGTAAASGADQAGAAGAVPDGSDAKSTPEGAERAKPASAMQRPRDEDLDADSTTTIESRTDERTDDAKEATS